MLNSTVTWAANFSLVTSEVESARRLRVSDDEKQQRLTRRTRESKAKASGSPVQASVRHQQPTNRLRDVENEDEVEGDKKKHAVGPSSEQKSNRRKHAFAPTTSEQSGESRKRAQVYRRRKKRGHSGRGRSRRNRRLRDGSPKAQAEQPFDDQSTCPHQ